MTTNSYLRHLGKSLPNPTVRVIFFHFAGGNAFSYRTWEDHFPRCVELVTIELPGRGTRFGEPLCTDLQTIVNAVAGELKMLAPLPYVLFGHSMGALIAYLVAHSLVQDGYLMPSHLLVSGRRPPHLPSSSRPRHLFSDKDLLEDLDKLGGMPPALQEYPELVEIFLPIIRADFALLEKFQPQSVPSTALDCPITALRGSEETGATREEVQQWQQHTTAAFEMQEFEGNHFFIFPHKASICEMLVKLCDQALREKNPRAELLYASPTP